ncbi:16S rRNA (guanine(527)-N(7))-methyltransferase RsmG [Kordiimonas pumila]|uniref:Ribosomal RNA small subunit methyltransferase G n=1 Tax=Kordiimonas pumila TaxID=2161677 RepID=A0ABV7D9H6_9PROT|nr:16S rRNA (guanine(527)-N(7))-methyltransferase RsmG [Kordiimonas pumila]
MTYSLEELAQDLNVSRETSVKLQTYADLLIKWQKAKNLVSNSTLDDIWRRHFLDSAQMIPHIQAVFGEKRLSLLDIGSGAGFPGLVLSLAGVAHAHMVESNGRKCIFMRQVVRDTAALAEIHNERIESIGVFPVDIITSRACARVIQLINWSKPFLEASGGKAEIWLLKGAGADEELTEAKACWKMQVDRYSSLSDPSGVILRLHGIESL